MAIVYSISKGRMIIEIRAMETYSLNSLAVREPGGIHQVQQWFRGHGVQVCASSLLRVTQV